MIYTVWVCEADGAGTHHVSSHDAPTPEEAAKDAIAETCQDWDWSEDQQDKLHILGICKGNVEIIEWNEPGVWK